MGTEDGSSRRHKKRSRKHRVPLELIPTVIPTRQSYQVPPPVPDSRWYPEGMNLDEDDDKFPTGSVVNRAIGPNTDMNTVQWRVQHGCKYQLGAGTADCPLGSGESYEQCAHMPHLQGSSSPEGRAREQAVRVYRILELRCPERLPQYNKMMIEYQGREKELADNLASVFGDVPFKGPNAPSRGGSLEQQDASGQVRSCSRSSVPETRAAALERIVAEERAAADQGAAAERAIKEKRAEVKKAIAEKRAETERAQAEEAAAEQERVAAEQRAAAEREAAERAAVEEQAAAEELAAAERALEEERTLAKQRAVAEVNSLPTRGLTPAKTKVAPPGAVPTSGGQLAIPYGEGPGAFNVAPTVNRGLMTPSFPWQSAGIPGQGSMEAQACLMTPPLPPDMLVSSANFQ